ncbi:MAG: 4Fe-4S binding protein [Chloroflexi bacterium]|nr:4Fe-4S binding protein [Chloroflexota bacterium]
MPPVIDQQKCNLCGLCEEVCPHDVLYMDKGKQHIVRYPQDCDLCDVCRWECPENAISLDFPLSIISNPVTL